MLVKQLYRHKEENDFEQFYNKISSLVPDLKKFTARSLKAAESQSAIDRGFYNAEGILDEIYLEIFKDFIEIIDEEKLKTILFSKAVQKIEEKKIIEQETPDYLPTEEMLKQELDALDEKFTTQADGDLILNTELDDISYKQHTERPSNVILEETLEQQLIKKLDMNDTLLPSLERRTIFGALYNNIPPRSKLVLELFAFGNRSMHEISEILEVPEEVVDRTMHKLKERFRLLK
jgi:DNA-directed RNA polymerase specialized sigma24 family protein